MSVFYVSLIYWIGEWEKRVNASLFAENFLSTNISYWRFKISILMNIVWQTELLLYAWFKWLYTTYLYN